MPSDLKWHLYKTCFLSSYCEKDNFIGWKSPEILRLCADVAVIHFSLVLQVNLCQKLLFLHQLTHNVTTDCSLNSEQFLYMTCSPHVLQKEELLTQIYLRRLQRAIFYPSMCDHGYIFRSPMPRYNLYLDDTTYTPLEHRGKKKKMKNIESQAGNRQKNQLSIGMKKRKK